VLAQRAPESLGDGVCRGGGIALHGKVDVARLGPPHQVSHRAADEVRGREVLEGGQQALHLRQPAHALAQV
jgi:hypothetical protein